MLASLKRFILTFFITFLISALIFGLVAVILVPTLFGMFELSDTAVSDTTETEPVETDNEAVSAPQSSFSVLLVGTDYQSGVVTGEDVSADSIIFITVSQSKNSFVYVPIPTNMEVSVDGSTMELGRVYGVKDIDYLCEKVAGLTGLSVNYYAVVSVGNLENIIDKLGGVDFSVSKNMQYEDHSANLKIDLTKGHQTLDGKNSVNMLRYVSDSFSDRVGRNTDFLQEIMRKYADSSEKGNALELYAKISPYITTNFSQSDLVSYVDLIWNYSDMEEKTLEYPGVYNDDQSLFTPSIDKAFAMLEEYKNS